MKKKPIGEQGQTKLLCMVPELCYLTGLTDEMRNDFHLMKDIAAYTRLGPSARHFELKKFVENINNCSQAKEILDNWGIYFDCELTQVRPI